MNRSDIEWCDYTFNPITGCYHNCPYCYAEKITHRFCGDIRFNLTTAEYTKIEVNGMPSYILDKPVMARKGRILPYPFGFAPTLHKYRFKQLSSLKTGANIFVGAMADIFGSWVPDEWIEDIFNLLDKHPQHNYMFLTKNYNRYSELEKKGILRKGKNYWYGSTVTGDGNNGAYCNPEYNTFISIEPILEGAVNIYGPHPDWIIVGAETGNRPNKVIPKKEWIDTIEDYCKKNNIPLFMKDSLISIVGEENMQRDFPEKLKSTTYVGYTKNKLFTKCSKCRKELLKSEMFAILSREKRGVGAKALGYVCKNCYPEFIKQFEKE